VYIVPIPLDDGEDQGPDDWLARQVPTPDGHTAILDNDLSRQRREVIQELLESAVPADPAIRAGKVGSTEEARRLLADLPFQASLAMNEEATSGLVVRALRQFGVDKPAIKAAVKAFHSAVRRKRQKDEPAWKLGLSRTRQGQLIAGAANVLAILRNDDRIHDVLAFDDFSQRPVVRGLLPWERGAKKQRHLTDADVVLLGEWLETEYHLRIAHKTLFPLLDARCREVCFHPIREYLDGLTWDGKERVAGRDGPGWLTTYFGVEDTPYVRLVGRLWLISAVARVRQPGAKVDTMLILEGPQGRRKSSGLAVLGGGYFSDSLSDLGTKDSFGDLQGKWIIEMSELDALSRAEASKYKHFLTKCSDYYRPPFARLAIDVQRQCVFAGTINGDEYLKDWSGGRRFWPVVVGQILLDALRRDRDQLWAEADALYRAGEPHWVEDDDAVAMCATEQEARRVPVPFEDDVAERLEGRNAVTVTRLLDLLEITTPTERARVQGTIGKALRALKWRKARKQLDGVRGRFYVRPLHDDDDHGPTDEEILADLRSTTEPDDDLADLI
jgi:putative DNA primase/helicase